MPPLGLPRIALPLGEEGSQATMVPVADDGRRAPTIGKLSPGLRPVGCHSAGSGAG